MFIASNYLVRAPVLFTFLCYFYRGIAYAILVSARRAAI